MFVLRNLLLSGLCLTLLVPLYSLADETSFGGQYVTSEQVPYFASVRLKADMLHFCGASIISLTVVTTAAHCTRDKPLIQVWAGTTNSGGTGVQIRDIARIRVHENYVPGALDLLGQANFDIALLFLEESFDFTLTVQPIQLPEANCPPEGIVTITGWKNLKLHIADVPIISHPDCQGFLDIVLSHVLHEATFCTGPLTVGVGICTGDHGSPVVQNGVQVGIAVWNIEPCLMGSPSIILRVSHFVDWIAENM